MAWAGRGARVWVKRRGGKMGHEVIVERAARDAIAEPRRDDVAASM